MSVEITKFNLETDLFGDKPNRKSIYRTNTPHANEYISLPMNISPSSREPKLVYDIEVGISIQEAITFAQRLGQLQGFEIDLEYRYEGLDRKEESNTLHLNESFDDFKKRTIENWKQRNRHDLVVEAMDV